MNQILLALLLFAVPPWISSTIAQAVDEAGNIEMKVIVVTNDDDEADVGDMKCLKIIGDDDAGVSGTG